MLEGILAYWLHWSLLHGTTSFTFRKDFSSALNSTWHIGENICGKTEWTDMLPDVGREHESHQTLVYRCVPSIIHFSHGQPCLMFLRSLCKHKVWNFVGSWFKLNRGIRQLGKCDHCLDLWWFIKQLLLIYFRCCNGILLCFFKKAGSLVFSRYILKYLQMQWCNVWDSFKIIQRVGGARWSLRGGWAQEKQNLSGLDGCFKVGWWVHELCLQSSLYFLYVWNFL